MSASYISGSRLYEIGARDTEAMGPALGSIRKPLAGRLPISGVFGPCPLLPVTFAAWVGRNLIPTKKDQGAAAVSPVQGPAVAGLAAYSNPITAKEGPAHWQARVPASVCKGCKSRAQPGPDLWGHPSGPESGPSSAHERLHHSHVHTGPAALGVSL